MTRNGLIRAGLFFGVLIALPFFSTSQWLTNMFIFTLMYVALASSWNLIGGYAGYPSLGHAAFFGFGAYFTAIVFTDSVGYGWSPFLFLPVVGISAAIISIPIGYVAMKTRADVFAIVTITLLFMAQTLAFNMHKLTGGAQGKGIAVPSFDPATFGRPFYFGMLALAALAMGASMYFRQSKIGLSLSAIRSDEDKALGVGVQVNRVKVLGFAISVGITAMAGGVWAYYEGFVYPQFAVDPLITIGMVLMTFLGGRATLWGPVLGAFILVPAQQYLSYELGANQFYLLAYAAIFLITMLVLPRGVIPTISDKIWLKKKQREAQA